jgi:hypothetical protein
MVDHTGSIGIPVRIPTKLKLVRLCNLLTGTFEWVLRLVRIRVIRRNRTTHHQTIRVLG